MTSRVGKIAVAAAAFAAATFAAPAPAFAQSLPDGSAPGCVDFSQSGGVLWHTAHVKNGCSYKLRLRIILSLHTDGPCDTYAPGDSRSYGYPGQANLQNVVTC